MNKRIIALSITASMVVNTSIGGYAETLNYDNSLSTNNVQITNVSDLKDPRLTALEEITNQKRKENELKLEQERKAAAEKAEKARIANVQFDSYDIGIPSNITHEEMREVLSESHYSNFADLADAFVDAERAYGVNAFALVAIPGLESGWNTSNRAKDGNNNIVGMNVPKNASRGTVYDSKHQCILDLARQIRTYYLTPGAQYYKGPGTKAINSNYSAAPDWYKQVDKIGDELIGIYNQKYKNK
jgi:beta-N-acetylglucosaminidase